LLGYDTVFFTGEKVSQMVNIALSEKRIILTRDTHILKRRLITQGKVKAILIRDDDVGRQIIQVTNELDLLNDTRPFTLCMECNQPLETGQGRTGGRVPPYVSQTQKICRMPRCNRVYWKGTHWEAMTRRLEKLKSDKK
jgi:uncharacterized protein with PIN domain